MQNKYIALFNDVIAPHLHALVNTVSECKRVKVLIHEWDQEIEKIWPIQTVTVNESTSDLIARLSFAIDGLRDRFYSGLSRKQVIKEIHQVFDISILFYSEFDASKDIAHLINKFCETVDKKMGARILASKLRLFKRIHQTIGKHRSPTIPEPTQPTPPRPEPAVPEKPDPISRSKRQNKNWIVIMIIVILVIGLVAFWFYRAEESSITIKTQPVNKTISETVPQQLSFIDHLNDKERYPDGAVISLRGFLRYGLPKGVTSGAYAYFIVDDFGKEIVLIDLADAQKQFFKKGQMTAEIYEVTGKIKHQNNELKSDVSDMVVSERPVTIVNKQISIQENITQNVNQSKINSVTAFVTGLFKSQIECSDKTPKNSCSENKPYFCKRGELIENPIDCGCPDDQRLYEGKCIKLVRCSDDTLEPECSKNQPYQCDNGKLVEKASICGCPENYREKGDNCIQIQKCEDGTLYGECSGNVPFFCLGGNLIEKAGICGCPSDETAQGDKCVSKYEVNPKDVQLAYVVRGRHGIIEYTVYGGLSDYLAGLSRVHYCYSGICPSTEDMELDYINEATQLQYIKSLTNAIQQQTSNADDQARIAISLVQNIPYDMQGFRTGNLRGRYPYEVLYEQKGVCGEKSKLLAMLLKELGFGVVLFEYQEQQHQAVGIKCPTQYSLEGSGYCFVETARTTIITDDQGDYVNAGKLSPNPTIIHVSDGASFDTVETEYTDAQKMIAIERMSDANGRVLDAWTYTEWRELIQKYGIELDDATGQFYI